MRQGPINIYGLPMIDGTRFAIDDINANGGVLGRPLRLIELDAQSNNQLYTEYASKLILENEVPVLMGGITSASREAMRPVVDRYQALYFYNEQYEGGVCDKFVFCTGVTPAQQLGVLVPWAVENPARSSTRWPPITITGTSRPTGSRSSWTRPAAASSAGSSSRSTWSPSAR